ncbi:MAG: hypothetical protein JNN08_22535 [Bryobacterales bacterium]|nr:hypothetical protein [Bryobacterales bacterium]
MDAMPPATPHRSGPPVRLLAAFARTLCAILLVMPLPAQRGRYAPPAAVECDRNNLTSYIGQVIRYTRKEGRIRLAIKTDEDTEETVSFQPGDKVLIDAREMKPEDWKKVEEQPGKLKPGMRAIAWVCRGGRPVLDWRPPQP